MATKVTIEGSRITPTDKLRAGERRTVLLTPDVQAFIDRGFAVLVSSEEIPDVVAPAEPEAPEPDEVPVPDTADEGDVAPDPEPDPEPEEAPRRGRRSRAADASE